MSALQVKRRARNVLMFIPNMVLLCVRLLSDRRVPKTEKALVAGAIVYALIPLDLIPDMIPFVGQIDDAYLISLTLLRLLHRSDPRILREHWDGGGDIVDLVEAAVATTSRLLPKRIRHVLNARVVPVEGASIVKPVLVASEEDNPAGVLAANSSERPV